MTRQRHDDGFAAVEAALGLVMLLIVGSVALSVPTWLERRSAADMAAREGARAAVLADPIEAGDSAAFTALSVAANLRVPVESVHLELIPRGASTPVPWRAPDWGDTVFVTITVHIPRAVIGPDWLGDFAMSVTHAETVDPYRSY